MDLSQATSLATKVSAVLAPFCERIEIAGSIRRKRPVCNDIDLVCIPKPGQFLALRARALENSTVVRDGEQNFISRLKNGIQLDIFFARPDTSDLLEARPSNWGSLLLCRTGSRDHNIYMVERAKRMGLRWNPYTGVFRGEQIIASRTEEEIFAALELAYLPPESRER